MNQSGDAMMMEPLLQWLLQTTLAASLLIVVFLALVLLLGRHLAPKWRVVFGIIIAARLLLPMAPESGFSIFNLAGNSLADPLAISLIDHLPAEMADLKAGDLFATYSNPASSDNLVSVAGKVTAESSFWDKSTLLIGVAVVWLTGTGLLLGLALYRNIRLAVWIHRQVKATDSAISPEIRVQVDKGRNLLGIRQPVGVLLTDRFQTAALSGLFHPVVLLPRDFSKSFSEEEQWSILLHELAHARSRDVFWNWVAVLVQSLHWFNPLVGLAMSRFRSDRELACDAVVVSLLQDSQRRSYGDAIIKTVQAFSENYCHPALSPLGSSRADLKARIALIANPCKPRMGTHLAVAVLLAFLCGFTFTVAEAVDSGNRESEQEMQAEELQIRYLLDASISLARLGLSKEAGHYRRKAEVIMHGMGKTEP